MNKENGVLSVKLAVNSYKMASPLPLTVCGSHCQEVSGDRLVHGIVQVVLDSSNKFLVRRLSKYRTDRFWTIWIFWKAPDCVSVSKAPGEAVPRVRVIVYDRSQCREWTISHAPSFSNCYWTIRVSVATESHRAVPDRGVGKIHPVERPVPIPSRCQSIQHRQ